MKERPVVELVVTWLFCGITDIFRIPGFNFVKIDETHSRNKGAQLETVLELRSPGSKKKNTWGRRGGPVEGVPGLKCRTANFLEPTIFCALTLTLT